MASREELERCPTAEDEGPSEGPSERRPEAAHINPHSPAPARLGEIYTGSSWQPSELQVGPPDKPSYTGPITPIVVDKHRHTRWEQFKNAKKFDLVVIIFLILAIIAATIVIALMATNVIAVPDREVQPSRKMPLVNRDFVGWSRVTRGVKL